MCVVTKKMNTFEFLITLVSLTTFSLGYEEVCEDNNDRCIKWKTLCDSPQNKFYMEINCKATCGLCPVCEDNNESCLKWKHLCKEPRYNYYMKENCMATCGICKAPPTIPPPSPPTPTWKVVPSGECGKSKSSQGRVINGDNAKQGAWPWQAFIKYFDRPHCGGSIVSPFWVVTAAHCFHGEEALIEKFKVVTGEHDFNTDEGTETDIGISKIILHEKYNDKTSFNNDIALLKLKRPVPFNSNVGTVCLPEQDQVPPVGTECFITGWGKISNGPWSEMHHKLQQAKLPLVENSQCSKLNVNTGLNVTSSMLCAGFGPTITTGGCHGDSGGPLVCRSPAINNRWQLHGAVSWGSAECNTNEAYTVFAKVANFRNWLDARMKEN